MTGIQIKEVPKNRNTMNNKYHVYRRRFVKKTGLPIYRTPEEKLLVAQHPEITGYSRKAAKDAGVKHSGEVIGFLRVYGGYVPLYRPIERGMLTSRKKGDCYE